MLTARSTINEANILVLIPARYDSSRFPGKPLATLEIPGNSLEENNWLAILNIDQKWN